jgi:hypothetical protein
MFNLISASLLIILELVSLLMPSSLTYVGSLREGTSLELSILSSALVSIRLIDYGSDISASLLIALELVSSLMPSSLTYVGLLGGGISLELSILSSALVSIGLIGCSSNIGSGVGSLDLI